MRWLLIVCVVCIPQLAAASVTISEVAWMGSDESPNHEWIELYNSGQATDLRGWILHDANNLTIELSGVLGAAQYAVLERTSDASAPGAAFLLYTGALSNTGATLVLRNAAGAVVDQATGGVGWESIGGNNETKDTAQRTSSGWQTAQPTPGTAPSGVVTSTVSDTPSATSNLGVGTVAKPVVKEKTVLSLPGITLQLAVTAPSVVHVGQPVSFAAIPSGVGDTIADSVQYQWSLGNGASKTGKDITYTYEHPGTYVVVVAGQYKRQTQFQRHDITVLPVQLALVQAGRSYALRNDGDTEIDVGGYRLVGASTHTFPAHTIILPQTQILLPSAIVTPGNAVVALYDETTAAVALHVPSWLQPTARTQSLAAATYQPIVSGVTRRVTTPPAAPATSQFGFVGQTVPPPKTVSVPKPTTATRTNTPTPLAAAAIASTPIASSATWPVYALIVLLLLGTLSVYLVPKKSDSPPWD